jgi:dephospho-CoA kinase
MRLYGITGGIGMGKSATAQFLTEWKIPVADTDLLARQLVEPGQPALQEIRDAFGSGVLDENGHLRRGALAQVVFANETARRQLESILHPRIRQAWLAEVDRWRAEKRACAAVVIPLLFETSAQDEFDCIVCVACSEAAQRTRLAGRGWSQDEIDKRLASQWPAQKKVERADRVIWTEPSLAIHRAQLERIIGRSEGQPHVAHEVR